MGELKPRMAASIRRIREIFLKDWDPIGIGDDPDAQDEYDMYIMPSYSILRQRPSEQALVDYLYWVETDRMGFDPPRTGLEAVAQKLLLIDVSQDETYQ
jgi:hypothetical protein